MLAWILFEFVNVIFSLFVPRIEPITVESVNFRFVLSPLYKFISAFWIVPVTLLSPITLSLKLFDNVVSAIKLPIILESSKLIFALSFFTTTMSLFFAFVIVTLLKFKDVSFVNSKPEWLSKSILDWIPFWVTPFMLKIPDVVSPKFSVAV